MTWLVVYGVGLGQRAGHDVRRRDRRQVGEAAAALAESRVGDAEGDARERLENGREAEGRQAVVGDAVVGAHRGLALIERVPRDADGGSEVVPVALVERLALLPFRRERRRAAVDERLVGAGDQVARLARLAAKLPAESEIDRQVAPHLPGVLNIELHLVVRALDAQQVLDVALAVGGEAAGDLADASEQEVDIALELGAVELHVEVGGDVEGGGVDCVDRRVEVDGGVGVGAADGAADVGMLDEAQIGAGLESMSAVDEAQVVDELARSDGAEVADGVGEVLDQHGRVARAEAVGRPCRRRRRPGRRSGRAGPAG